MSLQHAYAAMLQSLDGEVATCRQLGTGTPIVEIAGLHHFRHRAQIDQILTSIEAAVRALVQTPPMLTYRGTSLDRLSLIENLGIDAEPTDSMIFACHDPTKSLEYGPVLLVLDSSRLRRSWCHLPADASVEAVATAEVEFGSNYLSEADGARWYTKGRLDDPMVSRPGECEYGFYLPGDPWRALLGVWQFAMDEY